MVDTVVKRAAREFRDLLAQYQAVQSFLKAVPLDTAFSYQIEWIPPNLVTYTSRINVCTIRFEAGRAGGWYMVSVDPYGRVWCTLHHSSISLTEERTRERNLAELIVQDFVEAQHFLRELEVLDDDLMLQILSVWKSDPLQGKELFESLVK